jgi:hypothetical protein
MPNTSSALCSAHMARLKRDAHLQGPTRSVLSTGHDAFLAPLASGSHGAASLGAERPETHPHNWGAVVSVEYSSKTYYRVLQGAF